VNATLQDLVALSPGPGQLGVLWLGQSGFALRFANATVVIDAFLSPHPDRLIPPVMRPEDMTGLDLIACTHEHDDHLDTSALPIMAAASPQATVVVPSPIVDQVVAAGVPSHRVHGLQPGVPFEAHGLRVHAVPALHGVHTSDAYTFGEDLSGGDVRFLGYVIESSGTTIYHAGDTIAYDDLAGHLRKHQVGVAFLPINGRDRDRESKDIVGNLGPVEAAQLVRSAALPLVVPMHYDMFAANPGYPDRLVQELTTDSTFTVVVPALGRPFVLGV
jgi:L-ascorbate 6-phosphate lactonase